MFGFGSEIASELLFTELSGIPAVAAAVGTNIVGVPVIVQGMALPAAMFSPEASSYDTPGFNGYGDVAMEEVRMVVKLVCRGTSAVPIKAATIAQRQHFNGKAFDHESDGQHYQLTFDATGAIPLTTVVDGDAIYRQLGTVYRVYVTLGG